MRLKLKTVVFIFTLPKEIKKEGVTAAINMPLNQWSKQN